MKKLLAAIIITLAMAITAYVAYAQDEHRYVDLHFDWVFSVEREADVDYFGIEVYYPNVVENHWREVETAPASARDIDIYGLPLTWEVMKFSIVTHYFDGATARSAVSGYYAHGATGRPMISIIGN